MWGSSRDLGKRLSAMVPALTLGVAAGVTGGVWAAGELDTTPYGETDLNTVSRDARQAGSSAGWEQAKEAADRATARLKAGNATQVGRLEDAIADLRKSLELAEKNAKKQAAEQTEKLARAESRLAETTAALNNATAGGTGGSGDGQTVEGVLKSTWVLGPKDKPWPQDCAKALQTYEVRVTAGADATVAVARLVDTQTVRNTTADVDKSTDGAKNGGRDSRKRAPKEQQTATLVCSMTYSTTVPTPLGDGYEFVVVDRASRDETLAKKPASGASLEDGTGPALSVSR